MTGRSYTRRDFLLSLGVAGVAGAALSACGTDDAPTEPTDPTTAPPATEQPPTTAAADIIAAECPGYAELDENEIAIRETLDYVDVSPEPGQYCNNCLFEDEVDLGECTGCTLFPGPVAPEGWCASWAEQV